MSRVPLALNASPRTFLIRAKLEPPRQGNSKAQAPVQFSGSGTGQKF